MIGNKGNYSGPQDLDVKDTEKDISLTRIIIRMQKISSVD